MHSPFSFFIFVMRTLTFELFKDSFNVLLSFHSFFSLMFFFMFLLRSFSRCFSSLGMLLLSSMSLRISASLSRHSSFFFAAADVVTCISLLSFSNTLALLLFWNTIEPASSTWCVICAPRCSSGLRSKCSSPSGRCLGSRALPAGRSRCCSQYLCRFRVHLLHLQFSRVGVGGGSAVAPLQFYHAHCISFRHHFHGV